MKIAVSSLGSNLDSKVDPRFGRAHGFIIYNTETDSFEHVDNSKNLSLMQGAGIQTAQFIADKGVDVVVSGSFGPKAASVLERAGIKMVSVGEGLTVKEAIERAL
ncbi:initrogenase iron-molybdenum cofactor biosynthesis protein [Thermotomaculum hydrothermale]|uniref:Initrogenase iron-molybdenum cofactor biosynthesis protein n=1 Tax=Thermotomaculum hydrothermale TaxID=981385 RepID=A0A7R6SYG3_9BACT|nr:NifB/NifX family molybdenum-iron cluster-binding protein [Thermotomaculum hydrothermale]BBB31830.1 initrogenase iron-molybdenum cofactor biosynthesis protein [Thermotomaculum hydrothermale]